MIIVVFVLFGRSCLYILIKMPWNAVDKVKLDMEEIISKKKETTLPEIT